MEKIRYKKILITGGNGFLGTFVIERLQKIGVKEILHFRSKEFNLSKENDVKRLFSKFKKIDAVIHLASDHGGLYYNINNPGKIFYNNILINTFLMKYSMENNVKKFISAGTVDCYPKNLKTPWREKDIWNGFPEPTSSSYAFSKKMLIIQGQAYKQQYNFNSSHLLFMNLYGPRDQFNLKKSHVIPAIIKKIYLAKKNQKKNITLFGSGNQKREFLYIEDAAEAITLALAKYNSIEPLNIGTGKSISIKKVVKILIKIIGTDIKVKWKKNSETGIYSKNFSVSNAKNKINFKAKTSLEKGLKKTVDWFKANEKY